VLTATQIYLCGDGNAFSLPEDILGHCCFSSDSISSSPSAASAREKDDETGGEVTNHKEDEEEDEEEGAVGEKEANQSEFLLASFAVAAIIHSIHTYAHTHSGLQSIKPA